MNLGEWNVTSIRNEEYIEINQRIHAGFNAFYRSRPKSIMSSEKIREATKVGAYKPKEDQL